MGEHRVSALGSSLRRYEDPATSSDPRIRNLVASLSQLEIAPPPRAHFRAELRAQLVAVTPRLVAEGPAVELRTSAVHTDAETIADQERRTAVRARRIRLARPVAVVVGVFAIFGMLLGGAVWISTKSLPGDALYSLKRANENVQLSMTHGTERGKTYLSFASTRADEVKSLLSHASALALADGPTAASGVSGHTAKLVNSTLGSADEDVRNAAQLLGAQAVDNKSAAPLRVLTSWAPGQSAKLQAIAAKLPAGALHDRVNRSAQLVQQAVSRFTALQAVLGCNCLDNASTDQLGPVPCTVCSSTGNTKPGGGSTPGTTTVPGGSSGTSRAPGTLTPGANGPGSGSGSGPGGSGGATSTTSPTGTTTVPVPLPTSGPVVVDSCGLSASVGPIGVGIGTCGVHITL